MTSFDAASLAEQLSQLGRDLDEGVAQLSRLEEDCVTKEGAYRVLEALHEDAVASAFLRSPGTNAEARKADARLRSVDSRTRAEQAWQDWSLLKAQVRVHQASLAALHRRIEIGRSLLSREKSLLALENSIG